MIDTALNAPESLYRKTATLKQRLLELTKQQALRRMIEFRDMKRLLKNIKNKSCLDLLKTIVKKQQSKQAIAYKRLLRWRNVPKGTSNCDSRTR